MKIEEWKGRKGQGTTCTGIRLDSLELTFSTKRGVFFSTLPEVGFSGLTKGALSVFVPVLGALDCVEPLI